MKPKPEKKGKSDLLPFEHGQDGTHHACQEQIEKYQEMTPCCECIGHSCKTDAPEEEKVVNKTAKVVNKVVKPTPAPEEEKKCELSCGCRENVCVCDPMRHWPPKCCKECPMTKSNPELREEIDIILEQFYRDELPDKACKAILQVFSKTLNEIIEQSKPILHTDKTPEGFAKKMKYLVDGGDPTEDAVNEYEQNIRQKARERGIL